MGELCSNKFHVSERSVLLTLWPKNLQHLALAPRMDLPRGNLLSPEYWGFFHDSIFFHPMNWFNMLQPLSPDPRIFPDLHHGYEASANWVPPSEASFARTKHSPHKWSANDQEWMVHRTLTGFNRRLILFVATRIFFPSSFLYSEETNKNICKWLTTTFSKLNPAPISQLLEHSQHCFVPLYVRTWCANLCYGPWYHYVCGTFGIPCSVRNNIATCLSKYQSPIIPCHTTSNMTIKPPRSKHSFVKSTICNVSYHGEYNK